MSETIPETFDEEYFLRGKSSGKSNYENYTWKRDLTVFCAQRMALYLGCKHGDTIADWGCSRGFYVRALRMAGYDAIGYDISKWAIENCDPEVRGLVANTIPENRVDWIFCKDTAEHVPMAELADVFRTFTKIARRGALIIVPLGERGRYLAPQDNEDKTHVTCMSLPSWLALIQAVIDESNVPWVVQGGYKLPGVKEACDPYPGSVGFLTMRRLL